MTNTNHLMRFLRGLFAALIAMSVFVSSLAHASVLDGHSSALAAKLAGSSHAADAAHDHGPAAEKASLVTKAESQKPAGQYDGTPCKMQCEFSMIVPLSYASESFGFDTHWLLSSIIAVLPGEIVPDHRPPRA